MRTNSGRTSLWARRSLLTIMLTVVFVRPLSADGLAPYASPWQTASGLGHAPQLPWAIAPSVDGMPGAGAVARYWPHWGNAWQAPPSSAFGRRSDDDAQPDLTGHWQGSGGETVEIRGNHARIWGHGRQSCECRFFLVGRRLIAYSPDTDVVRKYWFQGDRGRFTLVDEANNLLTFWRTR